MTSGKIVIGFPLIGDGKWAGGLNYQRSLLAMIASKLSDRVIARVIVTTDQASLAADAFGEYLAEPLVVDDDIAAAGRGTRLIFACISGRDAALARMVSRHKIDVMFETARFFGWRFPVPILAWMPDFQHRHLPHLFSTMAWWRRDLGFRAQTLGRRMILLSSEAAERDCHQYYAGTKGKTAVARFSSRVDVAAIIDREKELKAKYQLPDQFFFLPNQFWAHKNHILLVGALARLKSQGVLADVPPVIMSGATTDHRHAGLYDDFQTAAAKAGLRDHLRHLGLIPHADVIALCAASLAVINPSLFEGWASSVEEAKSVGTPTLLSDIPVHREQAPMSLFFDPASEIDLAEHLRAKGMLQSSKRRDGTLLIAENDRRIADFAESFWSAASRCLALSRENSDRHLEVVN